MFIIEMRGRPSNRSNIGRRPGGSSRNFGERSPPERRLPSLLDNSSEFSRPFRQRGGGGQTRPNFRNPSSIMRRPDDFSPEDGYRRKPHIEHRAPVVVEVRPLMREQGRFEQYGPGRVSHEDYRRPQPPTVSNRGFDRMEYPPGRNTGAERNPREKDRRLPNKRPPPEKLLRENDLHKRPRIDLRKERHPYPQEGTPKERGPPGRGYNKREYESPPRQEHKSRFESSPPRRPGASNNGMARYNERESLHFERSEHNRDDRRKSSSTRREERRPSPSPNARRSPRRSPTGHRSKQDEPMRRSLEGSSRMESRSSLKLPIPKRKIEKPRYIGPEQQINPSKEDLQRIIIEIKKTHSQEDDVPDPSRNSRKRSYEKSPTGERKRQYAHSPIRAPAQSHVTYPERVVERPSRGSTVQREGMLSQRFGEAQHERQPNRHWEHQSEIQRIRNQVWHEQEMRKTYRGEARHGPGNEVDSLRRGRNDMLQFGQRDSRPTMPSQMVSHRDVEWSVPRGPPGPEPMLRPVRSTERAGEPHPRDIDHRAFMPPSARRPY